MNLTLEERIGRLERQNRWLKAAFGVLAAGAVAVLVLGQVAPSSAPTGPLLLPERVRAKRFEVINDAGKPVVTLMAWEQGGWIETRDNEGRRLFDMSATDDGHGLFSTYNKEGNETVSFGGVKDGTGLLAIFDGRGRKVLGAGMGEDGAGVIASYNRSQDIKAVWP
ncbi:MAG TPA: hypothetical protein PK920_07570 [Phycisphaerae bacterium]|nr:hypothetical protein [Phycisphaerae bacterium]HPC22327.1 hypothetical protein [Phycisphaerae bacterium]HRS28081.1 hypothetical protein [Phycisphaerae bacterium]HRT41673.1 hypothetical protein [Phycisphaerae bacterium]